MVARPLKRTAEVSSLPILANGSVCFVFSDRVVVRQQIQIPHLYLLADHSIMFTGLTNQMSTWIGKKGEDAGAELPAEEKFVTSVEGDDLNRKDR